MKIENIKIALKEKELNFAPNTIKLIQKSPNNINPPSRGLKVKKVLCGSITDSPKILIRNSCRNVEYGIYKKIT